MPGPWIHLRDNKEFYTSLELAKGIYLETQLYDTSQHDQGNGLWRVVEVDEKRREGVWLVAKLLAVSDEHLNWWKSEGPGHVEGDRYSLHLCTGVAAQCKKTKRHRALEFHSDYFRILDVTDLSEKCLTWCKAPYAKDGLDRELAMLQGHGRSKKASTSKAGDHKGLSWSLSEHEDDPGPDGQGSGLPGKLAALKAEVAPGGKDKPDAKQKQSKERAKSRRKKKRKEKSLRSWHQAPL